MSGPSDESHESSLRVENRALMEAVKTIGSTLDLDTVLQRLLYLTHKMLGFQYCTILLIAGDGVRLEVAARYGYPQSIVQRVELRVGRGVTGTVAETGVPLLVPDVSKEEHYLAGLAGARSELVVPLVFRGRVIGVFDVQSETIDAFDQADLELLSTLAGIASVAIINAKNHAAAIRNREEALRRKELERQLNIGRTIQEHLLPMDDPRVPGYDVSGMNLPSQTISGDYYDYVTLPGGHLGIAVADVSGKGVPAALLAASLQGTLRAHVEDLYSIAAIVERTNDSICGSTTPESYSTLFYGVLDPGGTLTYVNAGHNPPILMRRDGSTESLVEGGTVLGMFPGHPYREGRTQLAGGDYVVIFTDGLPDAARKDEAFGERRIIATIQRAAGAPARVMASLLVTEADAFSGPGRPADDITVVVARRLGDASAG